MQYYITVASSACVVQSTTSVLYFAWFNFKIKFEEVQSKLQLLLLFLAFFMIKKLYLWLISFLLMYRLCALSPGVVELKWSFILPRDAFPCSAPPHQYLCFWQIYLLPFSITHILRLIYSFFHFFWQASQTQDGNRNDAAHFGPFIFSFTWLTVLLFHTQSDPFLSPPPLPTLSI